MNNFLLGPFGALAATWFFVTSLSVVNANEEPPELAVEVVGANIVVNLPQFVEGLGQLMKARVVNRTGKPADTLNAKVSCGCLKLSGRV